MTRNDCIPANEQDQALAGLDWEEIYELAAAAHSYCLLAKTTSHSTPLAKLLRVHNRIFRGLWARQDKEAPRMPKQEEHASVAL